MIERTVSHYKILAKLGEGGMGTVYRGVDLMLDRPVAMKVLHAHIARQPDVITRFRAEAALLARLNDPNVATLYAFFREGDEFFMVMELVTGQNLASAMRNGLLLNPERAVFVIVQVLSALHHAHRLEILHRDIKPANILLTDDDTVKITDFGIARALGSERLTRDTRLVGTLEYLAPERIKGEEGDFRSDLYSAGAVLYELLTSRLPFERSSDFELMRAHLEEMPLPLRQSSPSIPSALETIVLRALAKRPEDRFATAKEMSDALAALDLRRAPPETRFVEAAVAIPETKFVETLPAVRKGKTRALWLGLASAGAVLVIVLVVLLTHSVNQNKSTQNKSIPAPPSAPAEAKKVEPTPPPNNNTLTDTAPAAVPDEEEAAQEKRAERARRRAAALKALEQ